MRRSTMGWSALPINSRNRLAFYPIESQLHHSRSAVVGAHGRDGALWDPQLLLCISAVGLSRRWSRELALILAGSAVVAAGSSVCSHSLPLAILAAYSHVLPLAGELASVLGTEHWHAPLRRD